MHIDWNRYRLRLHEVGRSRGEKGFKVSHSWGHRFVTSDNDLWYITGGNGRIRLGGNWVELHAGLCAWLRPDYPYEVEHDPDNPLDNTFFHFDLVDARGETRPKTDPLPPEVIEPPDGEMAGAITRRVVEMSFGFGPHGHVRGVEAGPISDVVHGLFTGLLMELDAAGAAPAGKPRGAAAPSGAVGAGGRLRHDGGAAGEVPPRPGGGLGGL